MSCNGLCVCFRHFDDPLRRAQTYRSCAGEGDWVVYPLILQNSVDDDSVIEKDDAEIASLPGHPRINIIGLIDLLIGLFRTKMLWQLLYEACKRFVGADHQRKYVFQRALAVSNCEPETVVMDRYLAHGDVVVDQMWLSYPVLSSSQEFIISK